MVATNPYIRKRRKEAAKLAARTLLSYGPWVLVYFLGRRFFPRTSAWFYGIMFVSFGLICVMVLVLSVRSALRLRRSKQWMTEGLCPGCGYDRRGLGPHALCPECNSPGELSDPDARKQEPEPPPKGRPVCARCGRDMTGREQRPCPDCGAFYGIDYFEE